MKKIIVALFFLQAGYAFAQKTKTENIIVFTLDGMRWQEVFGGTDPEILANKKYTHDSAEIIKQFWSDDTNERRKKLFPFFWGTIAKEGQLYGDRNAGSEVNNANKYWFSYPGYNEIFTGYPDTAVNSNDKIPNKNTNVLEFINKQKGYEGKVAAFTTWDVSPYFLNKWRSNINVNADQDPIAFNSPAASVINDLQTLSMKPNGERLDIITYMAAREYLKQNKPKVLYIGFDETDEYAHQGKYDYYLGAAHAEDAMIGDMWKIVQSMPEYKYKTTIIVTCDHGRGDKIKDQWRDHGQKVSDAGHIWIAVIGPDTKAGGEIKTAAPLYQKQIAPTIAALLGFHFVPDHESAEPITTIVNTNYTN